MRETDVRLDEIEARLRETQSELAAVTLQRDQHRMLRDSWHDQWRRDAGARALAEQRARRADELLGRAADLLTAWASCHDDPGLARRGEQLLDDIADLRDDSTW
jgi:hypothetical protein